MSPYQYTYTNRREFFGGKLVTENNAPQNVPHTLSGIVHILTRHSAMISVYVYVFVLCLYGLPRRGFS